MAATLYSNITPATAQEIVIAFRFFILLSFALEFQLSKR
jgi:hypothetical protein